MVLCSNMIEDKFEKLNNCTYCNSTQIFDLFSSPDRFNIADSGEKFYLSKCRQCKLVFQNPRIKEKYISDYYGDSLGYLKQTKEREGFLENLKAKVKKYILINHFGYTNLGEKNLILKFLLYPFKRNRYGQLVPVYIKNGKLLDVGSAYGFNLMNLRKIGWKNVVGQDMHKKSVEFSRSNGIETYGGRIEDLNFPCNTFDVIVTSMVLEHVYNPFKVIEQITKWIKPSGQLIFSIPYFEGLEYKWFKEYTYSLHLPNHITFLNKKVIKEYLTKLGYINIKIHFQSFDRDIIGSAGFKYEETGNVFYKILSKNKFIRYALIKPIVYIMSIFGKTSRVTVYANKK